ncbi:arylsulfatase [Flexithrix dorotheae]|uniref:arylsulfatase n=1 Tax=Flexithrix dorotheae TaxID=70993 RepID=UPI00036AC376|nr:arylsulfatase [Flexithrix dorotheae]
MKLLSLTLFLTILFFNSCQKETTETPESSADERPNIVLIMVDDMGFSDLGIFGSRIQTPNIDQLANEGVLFSQFYNTSRCCPSRAALMTGLYQHQAGIGDMTGDHGYPSYQGRLNKSCVTIAEVLKDAGYSTLMSGKWHLGSGKDYWPRQRGFEQFYGVPEGGGVYFYPFNRKRSVVLNDSVLALDETYYSTTAFNENAVKFIDEAAKKDNPFFLYLAHIAPHFPIQAPKEVYQKYLGKFMDGFDALKKEKLDQLKKLGFFGPQMQLSEVDDVVLNWDQLTQEEKEFYDHKMAIYAAQLEMVDHGVGEIIKTLKANGALENTAIFFLSDNGGTHEELGFDPLNIEDKDKLGSNETYRSYGRAWANVSNTPFRMYKHWVHEGGISSPLIFHYPNMKKADKLNHEVAHIMDIMPTCVELAETTYPDEYHGNKILPMEGKSLLPLIKNGKREDHEALFWEHEGNKAVRVGDWKLVASFPEEVWRLYNVKEDRIEMKDLSSENPEKGKELTEKYEAWANRVGVVDRKLLVKK